jgi:hypothetical protein
MVLYAWKDTIKELLPPSLPAGFNVSLAWVEEQNGYPAYSYKGSPPFQSPATQKTKQADRSQEGLFMEEERGTARICTSTTTTIAAPRQAEAS